MPLIDAKVDKEAEWRLKKERHEDHNDLYRITIYVMKHYCVINMFNICVYYVL